MIAAIPELDALKCHERNNSRLLRARSDLVLIERDGDIACGGIRGCAFAFGGRVGARGGLGGDVFDLGGGDGGVLFGVGV